jgi:hydrogenase-4 component E
MADLSNLCLLLVILINFFALGSSRLAACIHAIALQGGILALLPLLAHGFSGHTLLLAAGAFTLKGVFIPWLLLRAMREVHIRREMEPLIGFVPTLLVGALATAGAFIFADLLPLAAGHQGGLFIPTSLATLLTGFLLLISRRKAITQVVGYLILENGIFIFGILLAEAMPLMVEAGVLLDLLVGVFVMGIVIDQINREFSTLDTEQLSALKE